MDYIAYEIYIALFTPNFFASLKFNIGLSRYVSVRLSMLGLVL